MHARPLYATMEVRLCKRMANEEKGTENFITLTTTDTNCDSNDLRYHCLVMDGGAKVS